MKRALTVVGLIVAVVAAGVGGGVYVYELSQVPGVSQVPGGGTHGSTWPCTQIPLWSVVNNPKFPLGPEEALGYTNIGESCPATITGQFTIYSGTLVVYLFNATQQKASAMGYCMDVGIPPVCPPSATTYDSGNITAGVFNVDIPISTAGAGYDIILYNPSMTVVAYVNATQPFMALPG